MKKISAPKTRNNDRWLREHFEEIVDKYAGRYILIGNNKILYTDTDGTPRQILNKCKTKHPGIVPLFFRVPLPSDFVCALII